MEFRKQVYATGHCYVSSHIVACDGISEDHVLAEDILSQVGVSRIMPSLLYAAGTAGHKLAAAPSDRPASSLATSVLRMRLRSVHSLGILQQVAEYHISWMIRFPENLAFVQVENDGEPCFGLLSQNFPDAANGPKVGTNEIVFNPAKAFPQNVQLLIDKGFVQDTGNRC